MLSSPIITLTTDWGVGDFFVGMVKGRLYSLVPDVRVVDITHEIPWGDMLRADFIVRNACFTFPPNTVHLVDVGPPGPFVLIRSHGQYFISCDNGLPYALFGDDCESMVRVEISSDGKYFMTFPAYSVFCQVAQRLCSGVPMESLGTPVESLCQKNPMGFLELPNELITYVKYTDRYGNADLSIRYDQFEQIRRGRPFVVRVREYMVRQMSLSYSDVDDSSDGRSDLLLTVSSSGCLQLAMRNKSAVQYAGLRVKEQIKFEFDS